MNSCAQGSTCIHAPLVIQYFIASVVYAQRNPMKVMTGKASTVLGQLLCPCCASGVYSLDKQPEQCGSALVKDCGMTHRSADDPLVSGRIKLRTSLHLNGVVAEPCNTQAYHGRLDWRRWQRSNERQPPSASQEAGQPVSGGAPSSVSAKQPVGLILSIPSSRW